MRSVIGSPVTGSYALKLFARAKNTPRPDPQRDQEHQERGSKRDLRRDISRSKDFGGCDDNRTDHDTRRLSMPPISAGAKPASPTYQMSGPSRTLMEKKMPATVAIRVAAAHDMALMR